MKIYVLRHEKRNDTNNFDVSLTEQGEEDSKKLVSYLNSLNIDHIYCSPYKRVLQTLRPYLEYSKKKVYIENSIYESLMGAKDINNKKDYKEKNMYGMDLIDFSYDSFFYYEFLIMNETWEYLKHRTTNFLENLIKKFRNTDKKILLVSHMTTINSMINRNPKDYYKQGCLSKIYDSNINKEDKSNCFEIIN